MKTLLYYLKIQATLGFAVIVVALLAGLAPPTAQEQEVFFDEMDAIEDVRDDRIFAANAIYSATVISQTALLAKCMAVAPWTGPGSLAAAATCLGLYTAGMAAAQENTSRKTTNLLPIGWKIGKTKSKHFTMNG